MNVLTIFRLCVSAVRSGQLITRSNQNDKEFHFQNWFKARLVASNLKFEQGGRNSYPDFRLVEFLEGFELKGLAYPGRSANFDSNSQVPTGFHNGRTIYYVFGRYPKKPDGNSYPVMDLVICHGDFLNADHKYQHQNKNVKGFGSYGDLMIRDRKMYVVPTPFYLVDGTAHHLTLITLADDKIEGDDVFSVGDLVRTEAAEMVVGYSFDLKTNELVAKKVPNPGAGTQHKFRAWRIKGESTTPVSMSERKPEALELDEDDEDSSD